jgi:hypothetical protein
MKNLPGSIEYKPRIFKMTTITPELIKTKRWKLSANDWMSLKEHVQNFVSSW